MNMIGTEIVHEPRFKLIEFNKVLLGTAPRWLVSRFIPLVGLTVLWGAAKSYKSMWLFDLMMHIALGWPYRGRRVKKGAVVYCAFEGAGGFELRIEAFRQHRLSEQPDHIPFYLMPATLDLIADKAELIECIRRQIRPDDGQPVAVVLDTLNRSLRGSESSDEDMAEYVRAADAIREAFQCAVILVHHSGHSAERPRGHSSLIAAADAQLSVKRDTDETILVTLELCKDGPQGEGIASKVEVVDVGVDEDQETLTSCIVTEANLPDANSGSKVKGQDGIALNLLKDALVDAGEIPHPNSRIPANIRCVRLSLWQEYVYAGQISTSNKSDAKRIAFDRASKRLQARKLVGYSDPWVWLV